MELILKFTDQNNNFSHGVEFGRIFHKLEAGSEKVDNNGFPVFGENYYGEWVDFMAIKNVTLSN